jgi:anti-sigma B factor antagonist
MSFLVKESERAGPVQILELTGRLALGDGAEKLNQSLQGLIARGERNLLLDCAGVEALDSEGIRVLLRAVVSLRSRGGGLKLMKLTPQVRWVLEVTRLLTVIETFDDEQAALRSF